MLKFHSISLMPPFIKDFKLSLAVRNGWQHWNAFVPSELPFLPSLYLKVKTCHINGYLLTFIKIGSLTAIQRDGRAINMDCIGFVRYLNHGLKKKQMETHDFWFVMDMTVILQPRRLLTAWEITLFSWFYHFIPLT